MPGAEVVLQEGREVVLRAVAHEVEGGHEQHEVDEAPQDARLQQDLAEADLRLALALLGGLPHLGLLDAQADPERQQRRQRADEEQAAPAGDRRDDEEGDGGEHVAHRIALLQDAGEEAALLDGDLLHRQRGAEAPLTAHPDAVQTAQGDEHRQRGREAGAELDGGVEEHAGEQRCAPADLVGPVAEERGADRPRGQGQRGGDGDLGLGRVEVLGDVADDEDEQEVVERVHRPAQPGGEERIALVARQARGLFPQHADSHEIPPWGRALPRSPRR